MSEMTHGVLPNLVEMGMMAELYKAFGDYNRVRVLWLLFDFPEICVGDIAKHLKISESLVSHQLRLLKGAHIVRAQKRGRNVIYSIADNHVNSILKLTYEHIQENKRKE
ncbi:MAG: ArsR/SmtB family transcription factor [Proteocatella sp.]